MSKKILRIPEPKGEYAVGTFTFTIYGQREEVFFPGAKRNIPARVYYPALKSSVEGCARTRYMSENMARALKKYMNAPIDYKKLENNNSNFSCCYDNAPLIEGERFPLILFNHGLCSYREANSFLCIELASRGFVVISIAHPYDSVLAEADDGTGVELHKDALKKQYEPFLPGAISVIGLTMTKGTDRELAEKFCRIQDKYCRYAKLRVSEYMKDTLAVEDYARENLSHMIDFTNGIGAAGHSLGGATAFMLCLEHEEFSCGANLDGALFGDNRGKILRRPFLQISCKTNLNAETRPYIDHTEPVWGVLFEKMQHIAFSDLKHLMPNKFITGGLDPDVMHENVCMLHLELFETFLKKKKERPDIRKSTYITVTEHLPDISE